jgi:hypothetical protein
MKVFELYYLDDNGIFSDPGLPLCLKKETLEKKFREWLEFALSKHLLSYELESKEWKSFFKTATFQEILNALENWGERTNYGYEYGGRFSLEIHEREVNED